MSLYEVVGIFYIFRTQVLCQIYVLQFVLAVCGVLIHFLTDKKWDVFFFYFYKQAFNFDEI